MSLRAWLQGFVTLGVMAWTAHASFGQAPTSIAPNPPAASERPTLPEVEVVAEPPAPNLTPNFQPFAQQQSIAGANAFQAPPTIGYQAGSTTTGSWIDVPKLLYPGSVDTVTKQLVRDQQIIRTDDVVRNIAGAVKANGNSGDGVRRPDQFIVRGFELTTLNFRKNGFLDPTNTPRDYANVERVDVVKGPSSIAYGANLPSGTFNVTTKRAQQDRFADATFQVGSWDFYRTTIDANNMNDSGDVLFRLNAAYQQGDSFRDFGSNERQFIAPTVTFVLDDDTTLWYEMEYNHDRRQYDTGIVAISGDPRGLPRNRFLGAPNDFNKFHDYRSTLALTHYLNDDWSFYLGGSSVWFDQDLQGHQPDISAAPGTFYTNPAAAFPFIPDLTRQQFLGGQEGYNHAVVFNLNGKWDGAFFEHNTLVGTENNWYFNRGRFDVSAFNPALFINPSNIGPFTTVLPPGGTGFDFPGLYQQRQSVYFQDLVALTDRWGVMYGARYDHIEQSNHRDLSGFGANYVLSHQTFDQGTPRVGLIFEAVPDALSFFSTYTTGFNPIGGAAIGLPLAGANTNPETSQSFETGFTANLYEDLTFTMAAFNISRQNVAIAPGFNPFVYSQADQRNKGVEATIAGNWTERLSTIANYSYTDARQFDNLPTALADLNGRPRGVPFNLANSWTRYNFIQERDRVVGAALGWVYVGERRGDYGSPLRLDSYNRWDIGVFGRFGRFDSSAYLENIFNARYETGSISQYQVFPGAPVNFRIMAGITW
jgi:iron complex outermembrane receptor protein